MHAPAHPAGRVPAAVRDLLGTAARLWQARDAAGAVARLQAALEAAGTGPAACAVVADACSAAGEYALARTGYDRALAGDPTQAGWWFNRATVRRFLGDLAGAETDYDACLALAPQDGLAWLNRSELRPQTPQRNHVPELEARLTAAPHWEQEVALRYALAKEFEDLGEYASAWQHLSRGAALRRAHLQYAVAHDVATVDWLIEAFPVTAAGRRAGHPSAAPLFVLGMPRTGSTLVDRILCSHSAIASAGELPDFGLAVVAAARAGITRRGGPPTPDRRALIAASAQVDPHALGADYLARTAHRAGARRHFTDKLPLNHLYCALIDLALPRAAMVHVERHPLATCYGVYKVLFRQGYPFSYDLGEIAEYFIAYRRLMAHWEARLPGRLIPVHYEALVADPTQSARSLFDALGLPWEPGCLEFHRNPAPSTTASAAQVRRPIYTTALHQWQHYATQLEPVRRRLEAAGIACD